MIRWKKTENFLKKDLPPCIKQRVMKAIKDLNSKEKKGDKSKNEEQ